MYLLIKLTLQGLGRHASIGNSLETLGSIIVANKAAEEMNIPRAFSYVSH